MELLLGALVVVTVLAYVAVPLIRRRLHEPVTEAAGSTEARVELYRELLELELDQQVGKVAEAEYQEQSEALLSRAAALISEEDAHGSTVDDDLEREIVEARAALRATEPASPGEERR